MDSETRTRIEETVLEILRKSDMVEATEYKIRKSASEKLGVDLSGPAEKKFVREVVESYLRDQLAKQEEEQREEGEETQVEAAAEEAEKIEVNEKFDDVGAAPDGAQKIKADKEFDDVGGLIICRLSEKRMVTISEFKGRSSVSIREYYKKDGKELPGAKGVSLAPDQWALLRKNLPEIEKAIKEMESR